MDGNLITALIIDDDAMCREQLKDLLAENAKEIVVKEMCSGPEEGIKAIEKWRPDLIFLDVEMPGMTGFDMLKKIPAINFEVIFTTAHGHYAIRAIRFAALDYLLKPVQADALQEAVSRANEKIHGKKSSLNYTRALQNIGVDKKELSSLAIPTMEGFLFVDIHDIVRCESDDKYTKVFTADKKMIYASRTLGDFEELLIPSGFFRIHKSYLINLGHLKKYIRGEGGQVVMSDGATLDVSRRRKDELLQTVSKFH